MSVEANALSSTVDRIAAIATTVTLSAHACRGLINAMVQTTLHYYFTS